MPLAPMLMFAILFGLSMDYEVFLMSRVREQYRKHFDPRRAVIEGVGSTARVITSAALIMIGVFASFILDVDVTTKMFGVGLAVAVLLDVTLVRMVLVPAAMSLLGHRAWWLPAWLERRLPTIDIEGGAHDGEEQPVLSPSPSSRSGRPRWSDPREARRAAGPRGRPRVLLARPVRVSAASREVGTGPLSPGRPPGRHASTRRRPPSAQRPTPAAITARRRTGGGGVQRFGHLRGPAPHSQRVDGQPHRSGPSVDRG